MLEKVVGEEFEVEVRVEVEGKGLEREVEVRVVEKGWRMMPNLLIAIYSSSLEPLENNPTYFTNDMC